MATIEVWGESGPTYGKLADHITIDYSKLTGFRAHLTQSCWFNVTNSLGAAVLEGDWVTCPYAGTLPVLSASAVFMLSAYESDFDFDFDAAYAWARCLRCGYERHEEFDLDDYLERGITSLYTEVHPQVDLFKSKYTLRKVTEASWETTLGLSPSTGTLIFWVKRRHLRKNGALKAAQKKFPKADILRDHGSFLILYQPIVDRES